MYRYGYRLRFGIQIQRRSHFQLYLHTGIHSRHCSELTVTAYQSGRNSHKRNNIYHMIGAVSFCQCGQNSSYNPYPNQHNGDSSLTTFLALYIIVPFARHADNGVYHLPMLPFASTPAFFTKSFVGYKQATQSKSHRK